MQFTLPLAAPTEVRPGLFLGGLPSLNSAKSLAVTHILSLLVDTSTLHQHCDELLIPAGEAAPYKQLLIEAEDAEDTNLLKHFPSCLRFISEGLAGGGRVLVHCVAGVSRSATIVTAYLMQTEHLTSDQAISALQAKHPIACPNDGFLEQLRLFEAMGCQLDTQHPGYKPYVLGEVGRQWQENGFVDQESLPLPHETGDQGEQMYRCRKCRRLVATSSNRVPVEQRAGSGGFPWRKRGKGGPGDADTESSLFVEPLRWMENVVGGEVQGKLHCPGCGARLGSFNWAGTQSNMGAWVTPAFQLHLSRLDALPHAGPPPALLNIRRPLVGPAAVTGATFPAAGGPSADTRLPMLYVWLY
ncbi:hypothetical protein WJX72_005260 [[Myrmecia] bisecta]|uniref:protein-tyrosine-phosphatase n=1 Tax=[Myrmecia] bisecta TaxID=41462 RepID=A0AAW1PTR4_9CHLO